MSKEEYNREYHKKSFTQLYLMLSIKYDEDILEKLKSVDNVTDYVRQLIKADMEEEKNASK